MKKVKFMTLINASRKKIWDVLWTDASYKTWTSVFSEGSHAETDWKEGSKVLFLGPDGGGMYSMIEKIIPEKYMAFKHLGVMKEGKELPLDEETKNWSGAMETYSLIENNGSTELMVEMDVTDEFYDYFSKTFPDALEKVKELAEESS